MRSLLIFVSLLFCISTVAGAAESSFTQADRERLIRLEDGLKATNQRIDATNQRIDATNQRFDATNQRIDATNQRIDDLRADMKIRFEQVDKRFEQVDKRFDQMLTLILWGFGILFGLFFSGMGFLVGFVLWDRRTALAPAIQKTSEVEKQSELLKNTLKEVAAKDPHVKEALKHVGLW